MLGKPEIAQQLNRALREDLQNALAAGAALAELIAILRLAIAHTNAEGAGLVAASILGESAPRWRKLSAEIRAHIEQQECTLEADFLIKVVGRPWREGPSAVLQVLATQTLGADVVGAGEE